MKIIHLLTTNTFSGAENVVCQIIEMYKNDKNMEMYYCSCNGPIEEKLKEKKINYIGLDKFSYSNIKQVVEEYKPDIIHAHDIKASVIAALFKKKCKIISHVHGNSENMKKISPKSLLYFLSSFSFKHIFWVSDSSYNEYVLKNIICKKSSILVNIIDISEVIKKAQEKNKEKFDVIFVGRLTDIKDPMRLVNIFKKVVEKLPKAKLGIVGNGDMELEVQDFIINNSLEKNIKLLGFQNNPYKFMGNSKIMMMTSKFEGTPMCALEGLTLGLPIVATPTDGLIDLIEQNKDGFLSSDNNELAEEIVSILTDFNKYSEMSKNAKNKSIYINDIDKYIDELNKYYF